MKVAVALLTVASLLLALSGRPGREHTSASCYLGSSGKAPLLLSSDCTTASTRSHPGMHRSDDDATSTWKVQDGVTAVKVNHVLDSDITAKVDETSSAQRRVGSTPTDQEDTTVAEQHRIEVCRLGVIRLTHLHEKRMSWIGAAGVGAGSEVTDHDTATAGAWPCDAGEARTTSRGRGVH